MKVSGGVDLRDKPDLKLHGKIVGSSLTSLLTIYCTTVAFIFSVILSALNSDRGLGQLFWPSLFLSVLSGFAFIKCGGRLINGSSVASLGVFIFAGFAGLYASFESSGSRASGAIQGVLIAIVFMFVFQLALIASSPISLESVRVKSPVSSPAISRQARMAMGFLALMASTFGELAGVGAYTAPLGAVGILIIIDSSLLYGWRKKKLIISVFLASIFFFFYYQFIFSGFGRLTLAVLAVGIAIIFSFHIKTRALKILVLVGSCVALPILSIQRLKFLEETRGSTPLDSEGIGSVVGPLISFGHLIEAQLDHLLELSWGLTFWDTVTLWVPRALWPSKPRGFGVDIVQYTQPRLAGSEGFSDAAMFGGELVWNFGVIGAFLCIPFVAFAIYELNKRISFISLQNDTTSNFLSKITLFVLASGLLHFIWAGTYTYLVRIFVMLVFLWSFRLLLQLSVRKKFVSSSRFGLK